jgi:hypothetical protein
MSLGDGKNVADVGRTMSRAPSPANRVAAIVKWPPVSTGGATSEPGSHSLLNGATAAALASSLVWNGAVKGETDKTRSTSVRRYLSIRARPVIIVLGISESPNHAIVLASAISLVEVAESGNVGPANRRSWLGRRRPGRRHLPTRDRSDDGRTFHDVPPVMGEIPGHWRRLLTSTADD